MFILTNGGVRRNLITDLYYIMTWTIESMQR